MKQATKFKAVAAMAALATLPALASAAPSVYNGDVIVKLGSTVSKATGSIANATDQQNIGCHIQHQGNDQHICCTATDLSGKYMSCNLEWWLDRFLPVVASINPASHVSFTMNGSGTCTSLTVTNGSRYLK